MHILIKELRKGLRVKCIWQGQPERVGKIGTILDPSPTYCLVKWDDNSSNCTRWSFNDNLPVFEKYTPDDLS
jgi:hypothetical protein